MGGEAKDLDGMTGLIRGSRVIVIRWARASVVALAGRQARRRPHACIPGDSGEC